MHDLKDRLPDTITTTRLALVRPGTEHVSALAHLANNQNINRWMSRLPFPYAEADARAFIDNFARCDGEHSYAITLRTGAFIGMVGLHFVDGELPELGYWLGEPYWGQGYGSEAAGAVVSAARDTGFTALRSRALSSNDRSLGVLRKVGFVEIGTGPDIAGATLGQPATFMHQDLM